MRFVFIITSFLWLKDAYAYLDPGTGSLFLQSLIATFVTGMFIVKSCWEKIRFKLFSRKGKGEQRNDVNQ